MRVLIVCLLFLLFGDVYGQINTPTGVAQGKWRSFLTQSNNAQVFASDAMFYYLSDIGLIGYNGTSFNTDYDLTPLNQLSSTATFNMAVDYATDRVFVAFRDGKIDYFVGAGQPNVSTILDLHITNNYADKRINAMHPAGDTLYIATNFGLLAYDLRKRETRGTYTQILAQTEPAVSSVATLGDSLYVLTESGIYSAPKRGQNLADGASWHQLFALADSIGADYNLVCTQDELYYLNNDILRRYTNSQWTTLSVSEWTGRDLINLRSNNSFAWLMTEDTAWTIKSDTIAFEVTYTGLEAYSLSPSGELEAVRAFGRVGAHNPGRGFYDNPLDNTFPQENSGRHVDVFDNQLYITPNFRSNTNPSFDVRGTARYDLLNDTWVQFTAGEYGIPVGFYSQTLPLKDSRGDLWVGSYDMGLFQMRNDSVINVYDGFNSPLEGITPVDNDSLEGFANVRVTDCLEDAQGNIWMTVFASSGGRSLAVHNPETGEWALHANTGGAYELIQDLNGYLWIRNRESGITVYDYNQTPFNSGDDRIRRLREGDLQGGLPNNIVNELEMDQDGYIWAATTEGVVVFFNTFNIFEADASTDASCPVFERRCLLEQFQVNTIAVDGANNKYYGTEDGGVYYINEDGTEELAHFTAENSPLIADRVTDLAINPNTGELFIATEAGVVSYQAAATTPAETMEELFAFPNPFRLDDHTQLTVRGSSFEGEVKVTTASGLLVKELTSLGGTVAWDGTDTRGNTVRTGIYLIHVLDQLGETSAITKVAVHGRR